MRWPSMLFDDYTGLLRIVAVSIGAYTALILVLRIAGKRSLAKLNAFDLVVTVALGLTLATVPLSKDIRFAEGALAFVMLVAQFAVASVSLHWVGFRRLVRSEPRLLIKHGRFIDGALRAERLTQGEVDAAIRKAGIGRLKIWRRWCWKPMLASA